MRELGPIVRLQVQRSGLKNPAPDGAAHPRRFDPAPLCAVAALLLTPDGVHGLVDGEAPLVDVHNAAHPETRNRSVNAVSIGFTAHYARIAERFGAHLGVGIAGENVIVECAEQVDEASLAGGLGIRTSAGELVRLESVIIAEPCVEFTRFALQFDDSQRSDERVTEGLQFLRAGMRGFYASYTGSPVVLRAGDSVFAFD